MCMKGHTHKRNMRTDGIYIRRNIHIENIYIKKHAHKVDMRIEEIYIQMDIHMKRHIRSNIHTHGRHI